MLDAYLEGVQDGVVHLDETTISMVRSQTARLARLAEDITAVSEAEEHRLALHRASTDLAGLISAVVDGEGARYDAKAVRLTTRVAPALLRIEIDPDRIGQVLGNLLDNALRHTPPRGEVSVAADLTPDGRAVVMTVADTGDGIPPEHLRHIFERFYRVDRARDRAHGGSGIGLSIAQALVEAHDGTITVASPGPRHGAVFTINLPTR